MCQVCGFHRFLKIWSNKNKDIPEKYKELNQYLIFITLIHMNSIFENSYSVPENPPRLEDNLFGVFTQRGKFILISNNSE